MYQGYFEINSTSKDKREVPIVNGSLNNGRIDERVYTKKFSWSVIRSCTCAYQGVRNVRFSENLACFVFLIPPF